MNASNLGDDERLDLAAASSLAQQLEQAEQQLRLSTATSATLWKRAERYREALEQTTQTLDELAEVYAGRFAFMALHDSLTRVARALRTVLTSQDSEQ